MATVCGCGGSERPETAEAVAEACAAGARRLGDASASLGLLFASPRHDLQAALKVASAEIPDAQWLGCSTAGELTSEGATRGGIAIMLSAWHQAAHRLAPVRPLSQDPRADAFALCGSYEGLMEAAQQQGWTRSATLCLGDGLNPGFEGLIAEIRRVTRLHHTVVGGGAGDDAALERTFVGTGGEALDGGVAALHLASASGWGVGIGQGATASSERMTVTRSERNVVHELDGRPALDVYRDYARERGEELGEGAELKAYLIQNELGIYFFDDIVRVRAGIATTPEGAVVFAGEVPEGASVAFVRGEARALIDGAKEAAQQARAAMEGPVAGVLLFSCVTRGLILGSRMDEEIAAVAGVFGDDVPLAGFLSYGEVARVKGKLDGYHNNTLVVAAIPA